MCGQAKRLRERGVVAPLALAAALAIACTSGPEAPAPGSGGPPGRPPRDEPVDREPDAATDGDPAIDASATSAPDAGARVEVRAIDLALALDTPDPWPVGVAVDPDDGKRYLLDARSGLYVLEGERATLVAGLDALVDPLVELDSEFTDLAACGAGRFLLTARNDGFLFDLNNEILARHFCYVPAIVEVMIPDAGQITGAVGCDATRIYAQPQTFDDEGFLVNSQVGVFDLETGQDLRWFDLEDVEFLAGGLVHVGGDRLLFVRDAEYFVFDLASGALMQVGALRQFGIVGADGLAYDPDTREFLISDGRIDRLFVVPSAALALP